MAAPAGPLPCPTAAEMAAINQRIDMRFEADRSAGTLVCLASDGSADLTPLKERTYQALLLMQRVQFDTPLPWTGKPLFDWFADTVKGVRFRADRGPFCCDPPGVINLPADAISPGTLASSMPSWPLGVMVHEARHVEVGPHTCGLGKDNTVAEMGAWGVQYSLMLWLGQHAPSLSAQERAYVLNRSAWLAADTFCRECP